MPIQLPPVRIERWSSAFPMEQSAERTVHVTVNFSTGSRDLAEDCRSFNIKLDLGENRLREPSCSGRWVYACRGRGRTLLAHMRFDGVGIDEIRAIVVSFAGETKRTEVADAG